MLLTYDQIMSVDTATLERAAVMLQQFLSTVDMCHSLLQRDTEPTTMELAEVDGYAADDRALVRAGTSTANALACVMSPMRDADGAVNVAALDFDRSLVTNNRAVILYELHRRARIAATPWVDPADILW